MSEGPKKTEELKLSEGGETVKGESIADLVRVMLTEIGEDPERDGLRQGKGTDAAQYAALLERLIASVEEASA